MCIQIREHNINKVPLLHVGHSVRDSKNQKVKILQNCYLTDSIKWLGLKSFVFVKCMFENKLGRTIAFLNKNFRV